MKYFKFLIFNLLFLNLSSWSSSTVGVDAIYFGKNIITMNPQKPSVEAVAIKDGIIVSMGQLKYIFKQRGDNTKIYDLKNKTLLPGFIDAHGHIGQLIQLWGTPSLYPSPVGNVNSIEDIIRVVLSYKNQLENDEQPIIAWGYDDSSLKEKRHPDRHDLDKISISQFVCVIHVSGHLAACNSKALQQMQYIKGVRSPEGGVIKKDAQGIPTGVLEETAIYKIIGFMPVPKGKQLERTIYEIQKYYASHGITTAQDGATFSTYVNDFQASIQKTGSLIDIIFYLKDYEYFKVQKLFEQQRSKKGLKLGGVKIVLDGSPQGKTAFLSEPYFKPPNGASLDYVGYSTMSQIELEKIVKIAYENDQQILTHCNGDACIDMLLKAIETMETSYPKKDRRHVIIHAQTIREDQVKKAKELNMILSFFTAHTYFWGDWHYESVLGPQRATNISPHKWAKDYDVLTTIHNDTPVLPPDMLTLMWTAVNRKTIAGRVLGEEHRLTAYEALKNITINAAYQNFEEGVKGSIERGKLADLVILNKNPLKVKSKDINEIVVVETIKEGKTIYKKK